MQIERINKGQWGKIRAFFDLRTSEGLVVKGFKIVEGTSGPFVGMPSQKSNDGQYYDTVVADAEVKDEITRLAMEAYGSDIVQSGLGPSEEPPVLGDDDIPF
ncbi:MAG: septation protein SpoVG family protein [Fidelibacterota bacterium]|nr:MAG: septation protein SpoVG family protein [Candidatus Neomarinimicrobiota bacterium]